MTQEKFCSVVFKGDIKEGISRQSVAQGIAQKFKMKPEQIKKLFDGKAHFIKKSIPLNVAQKLQQAFLSAGAITHIVQDKAKSANNNIAAAQKKPPAEKVPENISKLFNGNINKVKVSLWYRIGLTLVSLLMVLMPLLYFFIATFFLIMVFWYGFNAFSFLPRGNIIILLLLYITPIVAGFVVSVFMFKPFLAKAAPRRFSLEMNPKKEAAIYEFVYEIADKVGAPRPKTIAIDCEVNASASFYNGMKSFKTNELTLTLGMPLFAAMSMRQLAGVIAHEFGHFSQGIGMRATYIIRSVNFWFYRSVYDRDSWDEKLEELADSEHDWLNIVFSITCFAVGISRIFIRLLSWITDYVSHFMLRQMEYDADRYEAEVAGSKQFRDTSYKMRLLMHAFSDVYDDLGVIWADRKLVDDIPTMVHKKSNEIETSVRKQIEEEMEEEQTEVFSTHPGDVDRIKNAEKVNAKGIFLIDLPAKNLFKDYDKYAKLTTERWYRSELGIDLGDGQLISKNEMVANLEQESHQKEIMEIYFREAFLSYHFIEPASPQVYLSLDKQQRKEKLDEVIIEIRQNLPDIDRTYKVFSNLWEKIYDSYLFHCFSSDKLPDEILANIDPQHAEYAEVKNSFMTQEKSIIKYEKVMAKRIALALSGVLSFSDSKQADEIKKLLMAQKLLASVQAIYDSLNLDGYVLHNLYEAYRAYTENTNESSTESDALEKAMIYRERFLSQTLSNMETSLAKVKYPFDRAGGEINLLDYFKDDVPEKTGDNYYDQLSLVHTYVERLPQLYARIMGRFAALSAAYEKKLGVQPVRVKLNL